MPLRLGNAKSAEERVRRNPGRPAMAMTPLELCTIIEHRDTTGGDKEVWRQKKDVRAKCTVIGHMGPYSGRDKAEERTAKRPVR